MSLKVKKKKIIFYGKETIFSQMLLKEEIIVTSCKMYKKMFAYTVQKNNSHFFALDRERKS